MIYPTTYTQNNLSTTHIYYNIFSDPPGAPNITGIASTTPLIENQVRRISCISIAGNPLAELKWFRGDEELTGAVLGIFIYFNKSSPLCLYIHIDILPKSRVFFSWD